MKEIKLTCSIALITVARTFHLQDDDATTCGSPITRVSGPAHGELLGSTLGVWNTSDPQGASFLTRTLGKKDFDAGEGGLFAGSRARVQWTSTSFSFLREQVVGFATVPRFGDRDGVQLKMFGLVMADAAAPPRFFFFRNETWTDYIHAAFW